MIRPNLSKDNGKPNIRTLMEQYKLSSFVIPKKVMHIDAKCTILVLKINRIGTNKSCWFIK